MFLANAMYADGLSKILDAILLCRDYEQILTQKQKEINCLQQALEILEGHRHCGVEYVLEVKRIELAQLTQDYAPSLGLLEKCGVQPSEYEDKFARISADCLRISHGSVKPPQWQPA